MRLTKDHIIAWVERNIDVHKIRKGGQEFVLANPWGDSGQHFNISLIEKTSKRSKKKNFYVHDWRPGHQQHDGSFLKFVQELKGCSFYEALKDVFGEGVDPRSYLKSVKEVPEKTQEIPEEIELSLPTGAKKISEPSDTLSYKFAVNYLKTRAISIEEAQKYFIHYNSTSVIFPYIEFNIVVYWQSRSQIGKQFEFPPDSIGVTKSYFLYGFDFVEPGGTMLITEAAIDAISIGPGAVAVGGAQLSDKQVRKIRLITPSEIILAADNDQPDEQGTRAGIASIWHNYNKLKPYYSDIYYCIPQDPYKDWNDMKVAGLNSAEYIENNKKRADMRSLVALRNI